MKKSDVIKFFGGEPGHGAKVRTAVALGVTKQCINGWGEIVPESVAFKIHVLTDGKLNADPALYLRLKKRHMAERRKTA